MRHQVIYKFACSSCNLKIDVENVFFLLSEGQNILWVKTKKDKIFGTLASVREKRSAK